MEQVKIIIEKTETGFSAYSQDVKGIFTVGENFQELKENIQEVKNYQVEYLKETGKISEAEALENAEIVYALDLKQFFEYFSMINKSEFARYIGINPSLLRQYSHGLCYVSDERMKKIQDGLHKLAKDLSLVVFA